MLRPAKLTNCQITFHLQVTDCLPFLPVCACVCVCTVQESNSCVFPTQPEEFLSGVRFGVEQCSMIKKHHN